MTDHPAQVRAIADQFCMFRHQAEHLRAAATRIEQLEQALREIQLKASMAVDLVAYNPMQELRGIRDDANAALVLPAPPAAPAAPTTDEDETR